MKNRYKYIVFIIFLAIIFFAPVSTMAKEKLGTCDYSISVKKLGLGNLKKLNLKVTVYSDGSTGGRKIYGTTTSGNKFSEEPSSGLILGDSYIFLQYSKMFNKKGDFYKQYKEKNNCPDLQFIYYTSSNQLHFNVYGNRVTEEFPSFVATAKSTGGNSSTPPSETKTYCNKKIPLRNSSNPIKFVTTETNGVKEYSITLGSSSAKAKYNESISIGDFYFMIREEDYDAFWSKGCPEIYLAAPNFDGGRIIQTVEPADMENGSYGINEIEEAKEWEQLGDDLDKQDFNQKVECPDIIDINDEGSVGWILNTILNYIKIIGPVLVVLLSAIDFIKAVVGFDEKAMKEAQNKLIIRLVAAVALFLVPTLVQLLLSFINVTTCQLK